MPDFLEESNLNQDNNSNNSSSSSLVPSANSPLKFVFNFIWEMIKVVIISLAIIVPIRMFVVQPFIVDGASMEPNFHQGEYLVVDEISYRFADIKRGDVIIFHPPKNPQVYYIKRVIALPGEAIEFKQGKIIIYNDQHPDGSTLDESNYLIGAGSIITEKPKFTLIDNQYYVVGDNRSNSLDSRSFGPIDDSEVRGKVLLRALPLERFSLFSAPEYNL